MGSYTLQLDESEVARYRAMADRARVQEAGLWTAAGVRPGAQVVDVGCGPGALLVALAEVVGPDGRVVGVDGDAGTVATARALLDTAMVSTAEVQVGRAEDTGLEPGSFDVVMLRHVLAHNGGVEQPIVDHLATLVRPGGSVYLVDVDLTAMRLSPSSADAEEMLARYVDFHRARGNDPRVGLRLSVLLRTAGLSVSDYRGSFEVMEMPPGFRGPVWAAREAMLAEVFATPADFSRWSAAMDALEGAAERPLLFPAVFTAVGRRPSAAPVG